MFTFGMHHDYYSVREGYKPPNTRENLYRSIVPYDRTGVTVSVEGHPEGRYLNADWVRELHGGMWWIAGQAPFPDSMHTLLGLFMQRYVRGNHFRGYRLNTNLKRHSTAKKTGTGWIQPFPSR